MIAIPEMTFLDSGGFVNQPPVSHRHYRGRNQLETTTGTWETPQSIPSDTPFWDDMFLRSLRSGVDAAKRTSKPALFVWVLMAFIAVCYYMVPSARGVFSALSAFQARLGVWFSTFGMGLAVGIIVETVKVFMSTEKRWTPTNSGNALFNFAVFSLMGYVQYYRYEFQESYFGVGTSWKVLVSKVLFDQFVWTVLIANPYQTIAYLWKNEKFHWSAVTKQMFPFKPFWGTKMLPVLISNWAFWIPMASLVYCFPSDLQIPLSILAITIWVLVLSVLTTAKRS